MSSARAWHRLSVLAAFAVAGCVAGPPPESPTPAPPPAATSPRPAPSVQEASPTLPKVAPRAASWDVDLQRDEQRGGHTLARHIGRTDAQLKARLQRESISAASTYSDLEAAEHVVSLALAENERRVQRWIDQRSPKNNLAIRYRARDGLPTGRMLTRGRSASEAVTGAVVVLRWRGEDWYVLTTYPENPR